MKKKKSWREKLVDDKGLPKVSQITGKLRQRWGAGTMVIPAPRDVDALMRQVPKGRLATINDLRTALAMKHKTDIACPITTGIFSWIAAHAAAEAETDGGKRITPYWRTLKTGGEVNPKYPGGAPQSQDAFAPKATGWFAKAIACSSRITRRNCSENFADLCLLVLNSQLHFFLAAALDG